MILLIYKLTYETGIHIMTSALAAINEAVEIIAEMLGITDEQEQERLRFALRMVAEAVIDDAKEIIQRGVV